MTGFFANTPHTGKKRKRSHNNNLTLETIENIIVSSSIFLDRNFLFSYQGYTPHFFESRIFFRQILRNTAWTIGDLGRRMIVSDS
ncbi:hypothetical protein HYY75_13110 [bacterium]|nr:hypothetical protein [bacterium]